METREKMNVVYIAGPYRAETPYRVQQNIERARTVALQWWKRGWVALCPHTNAYLYDGECPDSVWLEGDMELLRRCDAVALVEGWQHSRGTLAEVEEAKRLGLPVYLPTGELMEVEP